VRSAGEERATISALLDKQRAIDGPNAEITRGDYVFGPGYITLKDAGELGAHPHRPQQPRTFRVFRLPDPS
jgi:hypothetical protein